MEKYGEKYRDMGKYREIERYRGRYIFARAYTDRERKIVKPTKLIGKERASLLYINRYFYLNTYQSSRFYFFTLIHIYMHLST